MKSAFEHSSPSLETTQKQLEPLENPTPTRFLERGRLQSSQLEDVVRAALSFGMQSSEAGFGSMFS